MSIYIPQAGLNRMLAEIIADVLTLRLFSNNITPGATDVAATYTEVTGGGYAALALGAAANWTITSNNPASALYNTFKQFDFTGAIGGSGNVYGYYITRASGEVVLAQRFPEASIPFTPVNGSFVKVKPQITLDNAPASVDTQALSVLSKAANYSILTSDGEDILVLANATSGSFVLSLYTAVGNTGKKIRVVKTDATANTVTLDPSGLETIDGTLNLVIAAQYDGIGLVSTGTDWIRIDQASTVGQVLSKSADYTVTVQDGDYAVILADATSAPLTISLFTAVGHKGVSLLIKKTDSSVNPVIIDGLASETIDGALTQVLPFPYSCLTIVSDGATWRTLVQTSVVDPGVCGGRLTLQTAVPVPITDLSAQTTLYFTPYLSNRIALYDGSAAWNIRPFAETSLTLVGLTASKPYDIFAYDNAGVVTLEALVWTNATTRATALVYQNGVLVKTGATTRRYLGTIYINASGGQTDDTDLKRYVWNYYNRVAKRLRVIESANSWSGAASAIWSQANASTANQVDIVVGVAEVLIDLRVFGFVSSNNGGDAGVAIGEGSTTSPATGFIGGIMGLQAASIEQEVTGYLVKYPAVGRQFYTWINFGSAAATQTYEGDRNSPGNAQAGLFGFIQG